MVRAMVKDATKELVDEVVTLRHEVRTISSEKAVLFVLSVHLSIGINL